MGSSYNDYYSRLGYTSSDQESVGFGSSLCYNDDADVDRYRISRGIDFNKVNAMIDRCSPSAHYNESQMDKQEKELKEKNMSYVGIMTSRKGLVAFGDSKGTRRYLDRDHEDIIQRKKVFKSKQFLMVIYGNNEAWNGQEGIPLEDVVDNCLKEFTGTYKEFASLLYEALSDSFEKYLANEYTFIFGFYTDKYKSRVYGTNFCDISSTGVNFKKIKFNEHFEWAGCEYYVPHDPQVGPFWTVDEMSKYCKEFVLSAIRLGDLCMDYNPVGGDVQIETLV